MHESLMQVKNEKSFRLKVTLKYPFNQHLILLKVSPIFGNSVIEV